MKFSGRFFRGLALTGLLFARPWCVTQAAAAPDLEATLKPWFEHREGGAAVAYVDEQGVVFATAGQFSPKDPTAITPDTVFEMGSVTKVFTALLLAESERVGKVSRNDPAAKYLLPAGDPDAAALAKITLVELSTHSADLPRMPHDFVSRDGNRAHYTRAQLIEAFRYHRATANPGGRSVYSNFGVSVLGQSLAAAWGQSYAEVLREKILGPLGLTHTQLGMVGASDPENFAPALLRGRKISHWQYDGLAPAGALRSTARDMALFLQACLGLRDTPLNASLAECFKPVKKWSEGGDSVGLNWMIMNKKPPVVTWHNGATGGFHTFVGFIAEKKIGVVVLTNSDASPERLGFKLLRVDSHVLAPTETQDATGSDEPLKNPEDYTGSFTLRPGFSIVITQRQGQLYEQATAQPRLGLHEQGPDLFNVVGVEAQLTFERDPAGKVSAIVLHQNGGERRGPRTAELTLALEKLMEYAGHFSLSPEHMLVASVEGGKLLMQPTGQAKVELFAREPDRFFLKITNAEIDFTRNAEGKVDGLIFRQNGQDRRAERQP